MFTPGIQRHLHQLRVVWSILIAMMVLPHNAEGASSQQGVPPSTVYLPMVSSGVSSVTNQAPTVNAGPDQALTLPAVAALDGAVTDDGLPNPPTTVTTTWGKSSGPGVVAFANPNTVDTSATFSAAGIYILRLTATDGALTAFDEVSITASPAPTSNQPPDVNAGLDQTIILPNAVSLDGVVTDDGLPNPPSTVTTTWSTTSGPGIVTFTHPNTVATNATFSFAGNYILRLTASDSAMTAFDEVAITVQTNVNRIVFDSSRDSGTERNVDVFVMNSDGSNPVNLTTNPATDYDAVWSPDGLKIAFVSDRDNQTFTESEIYVMNADGSNQTRVTNSPGYDGSPAWSPNGEKIAFTSSRDSNGEIYVMNADGSAQTRITNNTTADRDPTWSPDGLKIAFVRNGNTIWVMNADGTGELKLPNDTIYASDDPDWSPDGAKIAYSGGNHKIWVMNSDGSNRIQLTNIADRADWFPSWSADGTQIIFSSFLSGSTDDIVVINSDGTGRKNLTNHPANDSNPDWQP